MQNPTLSSLSVRPTACRDVADNGRSLGVSKLTLSVVPPHAVRPRGERARILSPHAAKCNLRAQLDLPIDSCSKCLSPIELRFEIWMMPSNNEDCILPVRQPGIMAICTALGCPTLSKHPTFPLEPERQARDHLCPAQSAVQIVEQVLKILQTGRQPDQAIADSVSRASRRIVAGM